MTKNGRYAYDKEVQRLYLVQISHLKGVIECDTVKLKKRLTLTIKTCIIPKIHISFHPAVISVKPEISKTAAKFEFNPSANEWPG